MRVDHHDHPSASAPMSPPQNTHTSPRRQPNRQASPQPPAAIPKSRSPGDSPCDGGSPSPPALRTAAHTLDLSTGSALADESTRGAEAQSAPGESTEAAGVIDVFANGTLVKRTLQRGRGRQTRPLRYERVTLRVGCFLLPRPPTRLLLSFSIFLLFR